MAFPLLLTVATVAPAYEPLSAVADPSRTLAPFHLPTAANPGGEADAGGFNMATSSECDDSTDSFCKLTVTVAGTPWSANKRSFAPLQTAAQDFAHVVGAKLEIRAKYFDVGGGCAYTGAVGDLNRILKADPPLSGGPETYAANSNLGTGCVAGAQISSLQALARSECGGSTQGECLTSINPTSRFYAVVYDDTTKVVKWAANLIDFPTANGPSPATSKFDNTHQQYSEETTYTFTFNFDNVVDQLSAGGVHNKVYDKYLRYETRAEAVNRNSAGWDHSAGVGCKRNRILYGEGGTAQDRPWYYDHSGNDAGDDARKVPRRYFNASMYSMELDAANGNPSAFGTATWGYGQEMVRGSSSMRFAIAPHLEQFGATDVAGSCRFLDLHTTGYGVDYHVRVKLLRDDEDTTTAAPPTAAPAKKAKDSKSPAAPIALILVVFLLGSVGAAMLGR